MKSLLAAFFLGFFAACATPEYRIGRQADKFAGYPSEIQEKIKRGQVDIGFTQDMVLLALGKPNREYIRTVQDGELELWAYVLPEDKDAPHNGKRIGLEGGLFIEPDYYYGVEYLRVGFKDGKAVVIDRLKRP